MEGARDRVWRFSTRSQRVTERTEAARAGDRGCRCTRESPREGKDWGGSCPDGERGSVLRRRVVGRVCALSSRIRFCHLPPPEACVQDTSPTCALGTWSCGRAARSSREAGEATPRWQSWETLREARAGREGLSAAGIGGWGEKLWLLPDQRDCQCLRKRARGRGRERERITEAGRGRSESRVDAEQLRSVFCAPEESKHGFSLRILALGAAASRWADLEPSSSRKSTATWRSGGPRARRRPVEIAGKNWRRLKSCFHFYKADWGWPLTRPLFFRFLVKTHVLVVRYAKEHLLEPPGHTLCVGKMLHPSCPHWLPRLL
ncbi:uncharacterized protein LOC128598077 [Nycticebus coucang]|uniref:uncharacterized protein LOC128598077 n=1 Tax=Nycticebus coucang TaxID=9470 RepID=UPI00234D17CE|nr:uncharacterized protein LOC128598077 [Nycticebus coucang]